MADHDPHPDQISDTMEAAVEAGDYPQHAPGPRPTSSSRDINANALWLIAAASGMILITAIVGGQAAFRFARQSERDSKAAEVDQLGREGDYNPRLVLDKPIQETQRAHLNQSQWADYDQTHAFVPMDVARSIMAQQMVVESNDE